MAKNLSIALISMPWMSPNIPSIQLATLSNALKQKGIESHSYEFFLDYAAVIGLNLYNKLCEAGQFIDEYLFATHYYRVEKGNDLSEFLRYRPSLGYDSEELEEQIILALDLTTAEYLERIAESTDWSQYNAVGFSLTISQTAASMALARLIKIKFPDLTVIFGGSSCAGPMGTALMRICPYVDVAVAIEGELVLPEIIRRLGEKKDITDLKGISWRENGEVKVNAPAEGTYSYTEFPQPLNFDSYFERKEKLDLNDKIETWLPFESSRGCWYGEKNQCAFCGLHEIMKFRGRNWSSVLNEMEYWFEKYAINRFFSVDLIMPLTYYDTLLPEISKRKHSWRIFYEIKANVKKAQVKKLAEAGVRWIQPGIESLDSGILKLMEKGVTTSQNIQLLKWCEELGIRVTWNIISGIPKEDPVAYSKMEELIPKIYHLMPPSGVSPFSLHRFSPYFKNPGQYGIKSLGANSLYKYIFPEAEEHLNDLVYYHQYGFVDQPPSKEYTHSFAEAVSEWKKAWHNRCKLALGDVHDGLACIMDTRHTATPKIYPLNEPEFILYKYLDEAKLEKTLWRTFSETHPETASEIEKNGGIEKILTAWDQKGLIVNLDNKWLALAISYTKEGIASRNLLSKIATPIPYLNY